MREEWILSQWLSSILRKNIGRAEDWTSDLFSSPQCYRLSFGAPQLLLHRPVPSLRHFQMLFANDINQWESVVEFRRYGAVKKVFWMNRQSDGQTNIQTQATPVIPFTFCRGKENWNISFFIICNVLWESQQFSAPFLALFQSTAVIIVDLHNNLFQAFLHSG